MHVEQGTGSGNASFWQRQNAATLDRSVFALTFHVCETSQLDELIQ